MNETQNTTAARSVMLLGGLFLAWLGYEGLLPARSLSQFAFFGFLLIMGVLLILGCFLVTLSGSMMPIVAALALLAFGILFLGGTVFHSHTNAPGVVSYPLDNFWRFVAASLFWIQF